MGVGKSPNPRINQRYLQTHGVLDYFVYLFSDGIIVAVSSLHASSLWFFCEVCFSIPTHIQT